MSASEFTKQRIANTMKELVQSRNFASVSVGDLIRRCGISRNTFYYHFRDKYEVVSWIFCHEVEPLLASFDRMENWTRGLSELCLYLQANREFYIRVLEVEGQNSFCECLTQFYQQLIHTLLVKNGRQFLSQRQMANVSRFISAGIVAEIRHWACNGMKTDPTPAIRMLRDLFSGQLLCQLHRPDCTEESVLLSLPPVPKP